MPKYDLYKHISINRKFFVTVECSDLAEAKNRVLDEKLAWQEIPCNTDTEFKSITYWIDDHGEEEESIDGETTDSKESAIYTNGQDHSRTNHR